MWVNSADSLFQSVIVCQQPVMLRIRWLVDGIVTCYPGIVFVVLTGGSATVRQT